MSGWNRIKGPSGPFFLCWVGRPPHAGDPQVAVGRPPHAGDPQVAVGRPTPRAPKILARPAGRLPANAQRTRRASEGAGLARAQG